MGLPKNSINVYKPRNPKASDYYRCIEDHFEELAGVWDDQYERQYGFWRPYVMDVILKYLDCGDLHCGFARVKCKDCGHEYLLGLACYSYYTSFGLPVIFKIISIYHGSKNYKVFIILCQQL